MNILLTWQHIFFSCSSDTNSITLSKQIYIQSVNILVFGATHEDIFTYKSFYAKKKV